jgi:hypothetical protein
VEEGREIGMVKPGPAWTAAVYIYQAMKQCSRILKYNIRKPLHLIESGNLRIAEPNALKRKKRRV